MAIRQLGQRRRRGAAPSLSNAKHKPNLISLAVATATGMMGAQAGAQAPAEGAQGSQLIEEVVVTGFRRSLQNAQRLKMNSDLIVEAISAEDLGKLPDNSIAESLARLPGLAGQLLTGRQQVISIRGLSPDFSNALLNGRQQVSAGDNRGVEYDQYPSDLLGSVLVYKTPDASLNGQGVAGTVDMQTVRPLEYGERAIAANVRYEWNGTDALNSDAADDGERLGFSYIDQFADDTFGLALGYSHISSPGQGELIDIWDYNGDPALITGANAKAQTRKLDRDAFMGVAEFKPNDRFTTVLDLYYSKFEETTLSRQFEMPLFPGWFGTGFEPGQINDGLVTSGRFSDVKAVLSSNLDTREADLWAIGWNVEGTVGEQWTLTFDVSHSAIDREDTILSTNYGTGPWLPAGWPGGEGARDTSVFTISDSGKPRFTNSLDYTDPSLLSLTSPQGWGGVIPGGQVGYHNQPSIDDELTQIRLSAERTMEGMINSVEVGVQYDERTKSKINSNQGFLGFTDGSLSRPFTSSGTVETPFGLPEILTYDPGENFESGIYHRVDNFHGGVLADDWEVDEEITVAYIQFGLEANLGSIPVTGNFGLRMEATDQRSDGSSAQGQQALSAEEALRQDISGGASYTEWLPSLNLNFTLAERTYLRFGAARTLARARMDDMRAGRSVNFNASLASSTDIANAPWGGEGGTPDLKPWVANAFDLSLERYFENGAGYVALAGFLKDLRNYIYDDSLLVDFSDFPTGGITPALRQGLVQRPQNGTGGEIKGLELTLSVSGELLHPALASFGALFNGSITDSEIIANPNDPSLPLPGLSEDVANLTLYYERGGFSARVSGNYRSEFLGEVSGFGAARTERRTKSETLLDAQVSYSFESGMLSGMTLYLQGTNLTDEPFVSYLANDKRRVKDYQSYGRSYFVGLSYKF